LNWETLYCPNAHCHYYGLPFGQGRLVKNGTYGGQPQARCQACGSSVTLRYGTAYYGLDTEPWLFEIAVRTLAEGNSLRATGRIVQIDKDTACAWLSRAAQHCRRVMLYLWRNLHVTECQLDELWSFVHTKQDNLLVAKLYCETYGDAWVWLTFAPVCRLVVAFVIGKRTQANANLLLARVVQVTDEHIPFFTSDQLPELLSSLKPDILIKGSNYPAEQVAGAEIVQTYGGQVVLVPVTEPVSASDLIQRIKNGGC